MAKTNTKYGKKKFTPRRNTKSKKGRPKAKSFAAKVKKVILRNSETKFKSFAHNLVLVKELYHDAYSAPYQLDSSNQMPAQGITDTTRIGDEIFVSKILVQFLLGQKLDRKNVTFRIIVVKCTAGASPTSYDTLFINTTDNCLLDNINTDRVNVVRDYQIKYPMNPDNDTLGGAREFTHAHKIVLPVNMKVKFPTDADTAATNRKSLYMYVFCYDAFGTPAGTANIAYCQCHSTIYYKDL